MTKLIWVVSFLLVSGIVQGSEKIWNADQIGRVKSFKQLVVDVDHTTLAQTLSEIENSVDTEMALQMQEAKAKTYADIVQEQGVKDQDTREWLWGSIAMNLAYLQMVGTARDPGASGINLLIRAKLKKYLPVDVFLNPKFRVSLE